SHTWPPHCSTCHPSQSVSIRSGLRRGSTSTRQAICPRWSTVADGDGPAVPLPVGRVASTAVSAAAASTAAAAAASRAIRRRWVMGPRVGRLRHPGRCQTAGLSLTVQLRAEFAQYRRESEAATRGTERLGEAGQEAGREIDRALGQAEDAAEDLRRSLAEVGRSQALKLVAADATVAEGALDDAADEAERLDRAIDQVSMEIARLNREILRTGDLSLFGRIDEQRSTLQTLRRMRAELGEAKKDVEVIAKSTRDGFRE